MIVLLELAAVIFLIWGFCNEDKFVAFEDKMFRRDTDEKNID